MSASNKKIVVFTATGDQGSSVCRFLLDKGGYDVYGITRNPESDKAKALAALGVKVVKGDLDDVASYTPHLEGLYGAYVNADFWIRYYSNGFNGPEAGEYEYKQSSQALEAVAKAGAKHIVYSSLDSTGGLVPHMAFKDKVTQYGKEKGYPVTNLYTGHYISNVVKFGMIKHQDDGSLLLAIPIADEVPLINFAVEQTGGWVTAAFENPGEYIGKRVDACSEKITLSEWAERLSQASGKKVHTLGMSKEAFIDGTESKKASGEELYLNYLAFYKELCPRDLAQSKRVFPDQWDTLSWAKNSKEFKAFLNQAPAKA